MRTADCRRIAATPARHARIVVAGAEGALARAIVDAALSRAHEVRVLVRRGAPAGGTAVLRGDLLDLVEPAGLVERTDVIVVPLGQADGERIDFAFDLQAATVLAGLAGSICEREVQLLLVGRTPAPGPASRAGAAALAERAALLVYAMHTELPWSYIDAGGSLTPGRRWATSERWPRPGEGAEDGPRLASHAERIVDAVEALAHTTSRVGHHRALAGGASAQRGR